MKNNEFQELVDQNLSGLVWDERKRQKVLHALSEEEKPVKKFSATFILIAAIVCISVTALAASLIFSNKVTVQQLAEKAVNEKYGLTGTMLSGYFSPSVEEKSAEETTVVFRGAYYVLGDYTVDIRGNNTSVSWSHDGEDTSGLFDAEAWGLEQLQEMVRIATTEHEITAFSHKALAIEEKHRNPEDQANTAGEIGPQGKEEALAAAKAAGRSEADLIALAKDAAAEAYSLTAEQRKKLISPYEAEDFEPEDIEDFIEDWFVSYHMKDGKPVYEIRLTLQQQSSDSDDPMAYAPFTDKDGYYWVCINVETGVIEDIQYEADINANG